MSWENSNRKSRLPSNWKMLRLHVLKRDDYKCQETDHGKRCTDVATEVDHIVAGDNHRPENLRALCRRHHSKKSALEGAVAAKAARERKHNKLRRKEETHPSLL